LPQKCSDAVGELPMNLGMRIATFCVLDARYQAVGRKSNLLTISGPDEWAVPFLASLSARVVSIPGEGGWQHHSEKRFGTRENRQ
jgi:hypothetical protein